MKILFLWDYYQPYLDYFYKNNPAQESDTYEIITQRLMGDYFSWFGSLSKALIKQGYDSEIIIGNDQHSQKAWARENNISLSDSGWKFQTIIEQIKSFKPDVLVFGVKKYYLGPFVDEISNYCRKIFCWVGSPTETNLNNIDVVLSNNPNLESLVTTHGKIFQFFKPGFDQNILNKIEPKEEAIPLSFIGQVTKTHKERLNYLVHLSNSNLPLQIWGMGLETHPLIRGTKDALLAIKKSMQTNFQQGKFLEVIKNPYYKKLKTIRGIYKGEAWGLGMYRVLSSSLLTFNKHTDDPPGISGNMRLFEATGVGTALVTEYTENLHK